MRDEIREGLAVIWHNRTLRALVWSIAAWQVFRHAFIAIVVLYAARELGFSAGHVGVLFMIAGLGSLAAAGVVGAAQPALRHGAGDAGRHRRHRRGLAGDGLGDGGSYWVASLLFGGGLFLLDLAAMIFFINYLSLRQAVTPDRLLGRVTATMICLTVSTAPLGGLAGGWVGGALRPAGRDADRGRGRAGARAAGDVALADRADARAARAPGAGGDAERGRGDGRGLTCLAEAMQSRRASSTLFMS